MQNFYLMPTCGDKLKNITEIHGQEDHASDFRHPDYEDKFKSHYKLIGKKPKQNQIYEDIQLQMDVPRKKKNKKNKMEHYPKLMLDKTSNQINCDGTKRNGLEENSVFCKNEPMNCTDFDYLPKKRKKSKNKPTCNSGNLNGTEHSRSSALGMEKIENLEVHNDIDGVQNDNFDIGNIRNTSIHKKKRRSFIIDREDLHSASAESLPCEDSPSKVGKNRKKKVKISMVEESFQEKALCDEQVHTDVQEREESFSLGDKVNEEDVLFDLECDDLMTRIGKKKKKKRKIFPVHFEYLQEEAVQHPECNEKTKKKKKRQKLPVYEVCQEQAFQNHYSDDTTISKVDESEEQENDREENPHTSGFNESFHVKRNARNNHGKDSVILDRGELTFVPTDSRHSDQQPNDTSTPKMKNKKSNDPSDKNISKILDISSPDCISNTVDDNEGHNIDGTRVAFEAVKSFNTEDSIFKSEKKQDHIIIEESVDLNESQLYDSFNVKRGKKQKRMNNMVSTFDQKEFNLTFTEGTTDLTMDEARPINVKRKKRNSDVENCSASEVTQINDAIGKDRNEDVNVEQQMLDFREEADKKTVKGKEAKPNKEESISVSEDAYDGQSSFVKRPKIEKKSSPKKIHVHEKRKRDSKSGLESLDSKIASALDISAAVSKFEAELLLKSPNSKRSPNGKRTPSRRSSFVISPLKGIVDRATQTDPQETLEGEFRHEERPFEPIVNIVSEDRDFITTGEHGDNTTYQDYLCDEQSFLLNSFGTHMLCEDNKKFECGFCEREFPLRHHLERHLTTHTPRPERSYTCRICDKQYVTEKSYKLHRDTHTSKKYKCDVCDEKFFHPSHVRAHAVVHEKQQTVKCDICNEEFTSRKALNGHLAKHVERIHKCEICGKLFCYRFTLDQHRAVHSARAPKVYECEFCPKEYRSRQNLHDHLRTHGERTFECPQCHRKFYLQRQLNYHMMVHSDQRPYACKYCEKAFKRGTDRTNHCLCHLREERPAEKRKLISDAKRQHSSNVHLKKEGKRQQEVKSDGLVSNDGTEKMSSGSSDGEKDEIGKSHDKEKRNDYNTDDETQEADMKRGSSNEEPSESVKSVDEEERDTDNTDETEEGKQEYHKCTGCRRIYRNGDKSRCDRCILRNKGSEQKCS